VSQTPERRRHVRPETASRGTDRPGRCFDHRLAPLEARQRRRTNARSGKEQDARLETYEQEVERASVESLAEHPEGSAPPLERLVDAYPEQQRK
jgi:hypothetical protein